MGIIIIILTGVLSFMALNSNHTLIEKYSFKPYRVYKNKEYYRFITHGFFHFSFMHLFWNMLTLYFCISYSESIFNPFYILFYFLSLFFSSLPDYFKYKHNPNYTGTGASGAVSATLFSIVLFEPWEVIRIFFILPVYFILFAFFYIWYSLYMSKHSYDNIGHSAHLYGSIFGLIATILYHLDRIEYFLFKLSHPPFLNF